MSRDKEYNDNRVTEGRNAGKRVNITEGTKGLTFDLKYHFSSCDRCSIIAISDFKSLRRNFSYHLER